MKHVSVLKSAVAASGLAMALAFSNGAAFAQSAPVLSNAVLKSHQDDLEAMLADLSKVQTPAVAKNYEGYLASQMGKYVDHHKQLHHVTMPAFGSAKKLGHAPMDQVKVAEATDRLSETHYPKLAAEMDRVEKLNPGLKKHFDVLRTLD